MPPKCSCGGIAFSVTRFHPLNAAHDFYAITCIACSAVIGTTDVLNNAVQLIELTKKVDELTQKMRRIDHNVITIAQALERGALTR